MNSQTNVVQVTHSSFRLGRSTSMCKSIGATTISLIDHAPSSLQLLDEPSPRLLLLEMPEYKYLKVLQAFRDYNVFELGRAICNKKCRYCDPTSPTYDIFNEPRMLSFPTPNDLMFWDSLQRCKLRSQWGHWPQVYQITPKSKRRQLPS